MKKLQIIRITSTILTNGISFTDTDYSQHSRGMEEKICSGTFRHLFATLHVRWLSHIFNCTACIYQTATWWDLPPSRITNWLINDVRLILVWLLDDLITSFSSNFVMGNQWTQTCINYHPCITREQAKIFERY